MESSGCLLGRKQAPLFTHSEASLGRISSVCLSACLTACLSSWLAGQTGSSHEWPDTETGSRAGILAG